MRIFICKERLAGETRVAATPDSVSRLLKLAVAVEVEVEQGLGESIGCKDSAYQAAGATVGHEREQALRRADLIVRVRKPALAEASLLKPGCVHVSFLDPFNERELIERLADAGVSAISMEMVPRTTLAQKMDALSSQASLAGYVAVILAAQFCERIFPMMITPAGTIKPLRVFIIGVGVAGLQAIATARRLGASVEAFDTRPVVEEQVRSLGARFVRVDLGAVDQTVEGYAKALTPVQLQKQRQGIAERVAAADVVITAAQVFGRKAPVIITSEMVRQMKAGSVIVDAAIESGGNVECSRYDEAVEIGGVKVLGFANLPSRVAASASEMYSNNVTALIEHAWDGLTRAFDLSRPIVRSCVVTHAGEICNAELRTAYGLPAPQGPASGAPNGRAFTL